MSPSKLLELDDARGAILSAARQLPGESVALGNAALGRVLGEDVTAMHPVPAFDNSAMDGFAVRAPDVAGAAPSSPVTLRLVGESRAGHPATAVLDKGEAIAISTGAMLPEGADAVLRVEDALTEGDAVQALDAPHAGRHVRRAGEDVLPGQTVLRFGSVIGPAELGVLASLGRTLIRCVRRPRVSVLVTGDELLGLQETPRAGAVRDTSSYSIAALAHCGGAELTWSGRAADEPGQTREAVEQALDGADVAVVCGGVSVGEHDHVRPSLAELGVEELFWGLALKPGSPAWFGRRGETLVFGLPGNPVSAMVTFVLLVGPALRTMRGRPADGERGQAILDEGYAKAAGRAHAVRCRLTQREDGLHATPTGPQGSHVLSSMLGADALALIPSGATAAAAGERVEIEHLREWTRA